MVRSYRVPLLWVARGGGVFEIALAFGAGLAAGRMWHRSEERWRLFRTRVLPEVTYDLVRDPRGGWFLQVGRAPQKITKTVSLRMLAVVFLPNGALDKEGMAGMVRATREVVNASDKRFTHHRIEVDLGRFGFFKLEHFKVSKVRK